MGILDKIFPDSEPLHLSLENADQKFQEEKQQEISSAKKEAEAYREKIREEIKGLEEVLEEIEDFRDEKGRKAVNDIAENIVNDRKKVIQNFSPGKTPEKNLEKTRKFLKEFQDIKRKEAAVLEITSKEKQIGLHIKNLQEITQDLEDFIEEEYSVVDKAQRIEKKLEERSQKLDRLQEINDKLEKINLESIEKDIEAKKHEIEEFKTGEEFEEFKSLQQELENLQQEKESIREGLQINVSKMERGLKKLIYGAEHSELSLKNIEALKLLRDQKIDEILEKPGKVEAALPQLEEKGEISELQRGKLLQASGELENLSEKAGKIEGLEQEVEKLEARVDGHEATSRLEELESEREKLEEKLVEEKRRREELKQEEERLEDDIDGLEASVRSIFESSFDRDVVFET